LDQIQSIFFVQSLQNWRFLRPRHFQNHSKLACASLKAQRPLAIRAQKKKNDKYKINENIILQSNKLTVSALKSSNADTVNFNLQLFSCREKSRKISHALKSGEKSNESASVLMELP